MSLLIGIAVLVGYFTVVLLGLSVFLRAVLKAPGEVVRKTQHIGFALSIFLFIELFAAAGEILLVIAIFMAGIYVGLSILERMPFYKRFFVDRSRRGGEMKRSGLLALFSFAALIALAEVLPHGSDVIVIVAVLSWGIGDALAALIGKRFGRRRLSLPGTDRKKTWTGSIAMDVGVFIVVSLLLWLYGYPWWVALLIGAVVSSVSTFVEAYAKHGWDTLFLPLSTALVLYLMNLLFITLGVL